MTSRCWMRSGRSPRSMGDKFCRGMLVARLRPLWVHLPGAGAGADGAVHSLVLRSRRSATAADLMG